MDYIALAGITFPLCELAEFRSCTAGLKSIRASDLLVLRKDKSNCLNLVARTVTRWPSILCLADISKIILTATTQMYESEMKAIETTVPHCTVLYCVRLGEDHKRYFLGDGTAYHRI